MWIRRIERINIWEVYRIIRLVKFIAYFRNIFDITNIIKYGLILIVIKLITVIKKSEKINTESKFHEWIRKNRIQKNSLIKE